jgi:hypothetical protein
VSESTNINNKRVLSKLEDERIASLKKYLMDVLSRPDDDVLIRTLSILSSQEIYILSLMATMADFMRQYDPYNTSILDGVIRNHLLMKISYEGAGRKDLKEILNPYRIYPFYPSFQPIPMQQQQEQQAQQKKRFKLF